VEPTQTPKILAGCGGCGCLLSFIGSLAGAVMLVVGMNNRRLDELVPAGGITLGVAGLFFLIGAPLLAIGLFKLKQQPK